MIRGVYNIIMCNTTTYIMNQSRRCFSYMMLMAVITPAFDFCKPKWTWVLLLFIQQTVVQSVLELSVDANKNHVTSWSVAVLK